MALQSKLAANVSVPAVELCSAIVQGSAAPFIASGCGIPVILVHGLAGSSRWWTPTLPLARNFRVLAPDLPGFGRLGHLGRRFSLERTAEWLADWMTAAGLQRAHVVAHSMGANVALRLALAHPARVVRLALISPAGVVPTRGLAHHLAVFARAAGMAPVAFLKLLAVDSFRGRRAITAAARDLAGQDLRAALERVASPTLVISAERDPLVPMAVARLIAGSVADAQLLALGRAGHVPMFEEPDLVNRALDAFLAGRTLSAATLFGDADRARALAAPALTLARDGIATDA